MMEHYTTQATDVRNLWLQGLQELALRQVRARDMSRPQVRDLGKTLHGMWQHLVLQGWNQIFTPPPHQQDYSGAEAQQNPSNEAPVKEGNERESRELSSGEVENNQEIWAPCSSSSEEKRSEEAHEKQETDAHSAAGTGDYKASEDSRCGMEITPEAPILRIELLRDDLILTEKEFQTSGSEAKTEPEARTFIKRNEEREYTLDDNRYNESWTYQTEEYPFIGQDFLPEPPGEKILNEGLRSFLKDDGYHEQVQKMRIPAQVRECPSNSQTWLTEAPGIKARNKDIERLFGNNSYKELWTYQAEAPAFIAQNEKSEHSFIGQDFSLEPPTRNHHGSRENFSEDSEIEKEEAHKKRENKDETVSFSKQGTGVWERSLLLRNGTKIKPEAPKLKSRFYQRDLLFNKKQDKYKDVILSDARDDPGSKNPSRNKTKKQREKYFNQNNMRNLFLITLININPSLRKNRYPMDNYSRNYDLCFRLH